MDEYSGVAMPTFDLDFKCDLMDRISKAVDTILKGVAVRVDVTDGVKVYRVKNIIRVDIDEKVWLI